MQRAVRSPVTCHTEPAGSCVSFGSYAGLLLTRNYRCDVAFVQTVQAAAACGGTREYPANIPRLEELSARADRERITRRVRIRDTDWQVFPRARENRAAPVLPAPRDRQANPGTKYDAAHAAIFAHLYLQMQQTRGECVTRLDFSRSAIYAADNNVIKFERLL